VNGAVPLKLIVHGASGRMGRQVIVAAAGAPDVTVAAALVRPGSPMLGQDAGTVAGVGPLSVPLSDDVAAALESGEVVVDFSVPAATVALVRQAAKVGRPTVVATTGLSPEQIDVVRGETSRVAVLIAPNLSLGVNLLFQILPTVARALGSEYDVEIIEAHHRGKKDAPSGTALRLADAVVTALDRSLSDVATYGRQGIAPRKPGDVGLHAVRAGGIVGEHHVLFVSEGEQIELTHRTFSRDTFARGALRAAQFLRGKGPGLYSMQDVLGE
jgi:4-hydroxy-tetrahydrodipicolinate reductase